MQPGERGVPVSQAATILGISVPAARKRVQRGSLRSYKVDGQWMVVLPVSTEMAQDVGRPLGVARGYDTAQDAVIDDLRDRVRFLEGLVNELMRRLPELPVGTTVPTESRPIGRTPTEPPQTPATPPVRRPWWRRWLGG